MGQKCIKQKEAAACAHKAKYHQQEGSDQLLSCPSSANLTTTIT
jgi:hypothetical protein